MELNGVLAPLPTPFTDDGSSISEIRLLRLLRKLQELGVSGYVACCEVGEFVALGRSERKSLVEILLRDPASLIQVVVNVSTLSTPASLDLAQHAAAEHFICDRSRFILALGDDHAFASSQAIRFHHYGSRKMRKRLANLIRRITNCVVRCWDVMTVQELFCEALARFQLCGGLRGTKRSPAAACELVHDPQHQG